MQVIIMIAQKLEVPNQQQMVVQQMINKYRLAFQQTNKVVGED